MNKKQLLKKIAVTAITVGAGALLVAPRAFAGTLDVGLSQIQGTIELGQRDIRTTIASVINVLMGLLGIIAVLLILMGGFKWMMAGGDEAKVKAAKTYILQGIVGMIIVLSAWAIARFVVNSLVTATQT